MEEVVVTPIGTVVGGRAEVLDDDWGGVEAEIVLAPWLPDGVLDGMEAFSHVEVVFLFDRVDPADTLVARRHPRGDITLPLVGALAQRHKARPGRIGLSRASLVAVGDRRLTVRGLDAVAGTPVLDIKPWFDAFGPRGTTVEPAWVGDVVAAYF
jgi:tRNA (Thr-GGU) A37 N-methylase